MLSFYMTHRNPFKLITLSIITLGIYYAYWYYRTQKQIHTLSKQGPNITTHILLSLLTVGLYTIYWHFAVGYYIKNMGGKNHSLIYGTLFSIGYIITILFSVTFIRNAIGIPTSPTVSYIIGATTIFTAVFINMILIQKDINEI